MKSGISAGLLAHLELTTTTVAWLVKITRTDGTVLGFTDHVADLVVDGVTYDADTGGFNKTAAATSSTLSVSNLDFEGLLTGGGLTESDIRDGKYDYADVELALCNYADLTQGTALVLAGKFGEVHLREGKWYTELRSKIQAYSRQFIRAVTPNCDADFGDSRCGLDIASYTETGTVSAVSSRRAFTATITGARAAGFFDGGLLTWTSGNNDDRKMEVKTGGASGSGQAVTLYLPMPSTIQVGDTFSISYGCPKTPAACTALSNIVNFRGFPFVAGEDAMLQTPDAT